MPIAKPSRGGKREGAGAPKDNLNALKHGQRSQQFARLGAIIAASPAARKALLRFADRFEADQREADQVADHLFQQILSRGLAVGRDRLILLPELTPEELSIRKSSQKRPQSERKQPLISKNTPPSNQSPHTENNTQSENPDENPND